jgi:hypothetical protein
MPFLCMMSIVVLLLCPLYCTYKCVRNSTATLLAVIVFPLSTQHSVQALLYQALSIPELHQQLPLLIARLAMFFVAIYTLLKHL